MENASKALIIAGAILLSILIIGLGMFIYQQAAGAMENTNLDPTKIKAFNDPFLQYEGTIQGSNARALYSAIQNNNRVHTDDPSQQIDFVLVAADASTKPADLTDTVEPPTTEVTSTNGSNPFKAGKTYYVQFQYSKAGYITKCTVTPLK